MKKRLIAILTSIGLVFSLSALVNADNAGRYNNSIVISDLKLVLQKISMATAKLTYLIL